MPQSLDHSKLEGIASTLHIIGHALDASERNPSSDGPDERKIVSSNFTCTLQFILWSFNIDAVIARPWLCPNPFAYGMQDLRKECPDILTIEDGCLLSCSGETGGKQFRAPPNFQDLPAFFGSGPRPASARAQKNINILNQLKGAREETERM